MYTNFYDYFIFYVDHRIHEYLCMCVSLYVCVSLCVHYISSEIWQLMFPIFLFWSHFFQVFSPSTLVLVSVHPLLIMKSKTEKRETETEANRKKNSAKYSYRQSIENLFTHTHRLVCVCVGVCGMGLRRGSDGHNKQQAESVSAHFAAPPTF